MCDLSVSELLRYTGAVELREANVANLPRVAKASVPNGARDVTSSSKLAGQGQLSDDEDGPSSRDADVKVRPVN